MRISKPSFLFLSAKCELRTLKADNRSSNGHLYKNRKNLEGFHDPPKNQCINKINIDQDGGKSVIAVPTLPKDIKILCHKCVDTCSYWCGWISVCAHTYIDRVFVFPSEK